MYCVAMRYIALDIGGTSVKSAVVDVAASAVASIVELLDAIAYSAATLDAMKVSVKSALEKAASASSCKKIAISTKEL